MTRKARPGQSDDPLWERVKEEVRPLAAGKKVRTAEKGAVIEPPSQVSAPVKTAKAPRPPASGARAELAPARPRELSVMEIPRREHRKIAGGGRSIDFRIDLHGLTQDEAFAALENGLTRASAEGRRRALIITGKGADAHGRGRGILKRKVPEWLTDGGLRHLVSEIAPAGRGHGGEGALYAVLRRRKDR